MEYIGNRPPGGPTSNPPPDRWWLQDWTGGSGRDYQDQSFEEAYREFLRQQQQQQQPPPQQTNEGQTTETPGGTAPSGTPQDPVFRTDVIGNAPQVDPYLYEYLLSLPGGQGGGTGGGGGNALTYFTDPSTGGASGWRPISDGGGGNTNTYWDFPETGGSGNYTTNFDFPKTGAGNALTYFNDPSSKNTYTYWDFPETGRDNYHTYFAPVPQPKTKPDINGPTLKVPPDPPKKKEEEWEWPPIPQPKTQPQQQNPIGQVLAALPMLAAFQGGTTTTPAPYAHLGPHTAVAPVFKPQARGNPIPSIGQLLAGVR